jgi:two-component system phosphate regulon sensor histidine kinase PhoR
MIFADKKHTAFIILYGIIVFLAMWGIFVSADDASKLPIEIWAAIGTVGASGAMLEILAHLRTRDTLKQMKEQISRMSRSAEVGLVMVDQQYTVEGMPGILNQYLILLRDKINQLKQERKELNLLVSAVDAEKQNTEAIIRNISDAVVVINTFGELTLANSLAEEIFGFKLSEHRHRPIEELFNDPVLQELLDTTAWKSREPARLECKLNIPGREKPGIFIVTVSPVYINHNELWALTMTLHDVTQERELAQLKNDFVNEVSHELRTPLSSIKAYIELLLDGDMQTPQGRFDFYRIIQTEADRLDRFIANILNLSRIESGLIPVEFSTIDLSDELVQAVNLVRYIAEEKSITLTFNPLSEKIMVRGERDLLRQAILNLLSNAVKYTPRNGQIALSAEISPQKDYYRISVEDNGIGISPDDMSRIFDKYYRCGDGKKLSTGTGLGLSLVKKVIEQIHHGKVQAQNISGKGSKFTLYLPMNPIATAQTPITDKQEILV